jgi:hypothetical protein
MVNISEAISNWAMDNEYASNPDAGRKDLRLADERCRFRKLRSWFKSDQVLATAVYQSPAT